MKKTILIFILFVQCNTAIEFPTPDLKTSEIPEVNTSIQAVWERVQQSETGFVHFDADESALWLSGYVISSDTSGNFYKELFIQDKDVNPTRGLRLLLDQTALHNTFQLGMKIYIKPNGLGAGMERGILSLGSYEADGVGSLPQPLIENHVQRSDQIVELTPRKLGIEDLDETTRGLFVQLDAVQFAKSEQGKTFAGEAFDTFDGERWMVSCENFRSVIVGSSSFSKFKSVVVDSLSGSISGIHTRDYYNEKDIFKINHPIAIEFQDSRCDPFFEESFETHSMGRFEEEGWLNWIEKGSVYWEVYEDENSLGQSLSIGSYRSRDSESICWLITPSFDVSLLSNSFFSFRTSTAFADNSKLEVLYSTNFTGDPNQIKKASWTLLEARISSEDDNDQIWIDSGDHALNFDNDKIHFAFRYAGSGKTASDGTFELDDIRVFEKAN